MNNLKKIFLYISASILLLLLIIFVVEIRTTIALNDYSMLPDGVKVVDKVVLGRRNRGIFEGLDKAFRRGAIELVCTNQGNILLLMKDYILHFSIYKEAIFYTSFRIENGVKKGRSEINQMEFLSSKYFDTLVSTPLSEREIASILQALKERNSNRISLGLFDSGYAFTGNAKISDVEMLINQCQKIK
jgi:hypothetical protein